MGTSRSTQSLHVKDHSDPDGSCVCGAMWVPSGQSHPRSPATGPGRCWNEGAMAGNVWELREMVDYIIVGLDHHADCPRTCANPATSGALSDPPAAGESPAND